MISHRYISKYRRRVRQLKSRTKGWKLLVIFFKKQGLVFIFSGIEFCQSFQTTNAVVAITLSLNDCMWWEQKQNARRHNKGLNAVYGQFGPFAGEFVNGFGKIYSIIKTPKPYFVWKIFTEGIKGKIPYVCNDWQLRINEIVWMAGGLYSSMSLSHNFILRGITVSLE